MSAEKIVEKILSEAQAEAQALLEKARAQAQEIRQQAQLEAQRQAEQILAQAREEAQNRRRAHLSQARLAARNAVLSARRAVLDRVFSEAQSRLQQMPTDEYRAWLLQTIPQAVQTGDEELILSPSDKQALGEAFLRELNAKLAQMGKRGQLKFSSETRELGRGFVLKGRNVETNMTLNMLLKQAQEELEIDVARLLFS
ncbi:MAG: V-type ATP synthase subunit E [Candidatus Bipolaricaulota bacterium]|nr:V-type ATP synthase subunit E [Candidatus Bipolaricaulota bacterium]MCS7274354.1 V-type ATP synthase subunit E [Candidatus Bipolaricaulota bacterium]MDW8110484.1 V-type ATP synthase subunit E [Candidatus Bipolaricaulota bacterium]MDW8329165.1 V-type ATP synthase subunit E [Candidatus Bipolaricaulota bacterium]